MRQSLHVHSILDDGKSTMEEMVLSAIERGLKEIGFSGHSYLPFEEEYCMNEERTETYHKEIDRLRNEYGKKIRIFRGLELDTFSEWPKEQYEYLIGSCHNVKANGEYIGVDIDRDELIDNIDKHFGGDSTALAFAYFDELLKVNNVDILGHFDLFTKFNENEDIFKEDAYFDYGARTLEELNRRGFIFEVNTGAIQRGYRTTPYPSQRFLYHLKKNDGRITITTDCHHASGIDFWYDDAVHYVKECGFNHIYVFDGEEFRKEFI